MQAITARYVPATSTRGSRMTAHCAVGSITIPFPHELSDAEPYVAAAQALIRDMGWTADEGYAGRWTFGELGPNQYVFVYAAPGQDGFTM
jgi:hypothetical protein